MHGRRLSDEQHTLLHKLGEERLMVKRIAMQVGCCRETVYRHLMNLQTRQRYLDLAASRERQKCSRGLIDRMKKRQKSLTDFERGYVSGFIDGEGSLELRRQGQRWQISLAVTNTNRAAIVQLHDLIGEGSVRGTIPGGGDRKKVWRLTVYGGTLRWLLPQLRLIVKGNHALLISRAIDLAWHRNGLHRDELVALASDLKQLNRRGKGEVVTEMI